MTADGSEDNKITSESLKDYKITRNLTFLSLEQNPNQIYLISGMEKMKTIKRC